MVATVCHINGDAGVIEVAETRPVSANPAFIALVCHPHPLYGGTMENKVVTTIARLAREKGGVAIRFNFRGVGASEGVHDDAKGEIDDLFAVYHWAVARYPGIPVWLSGFSFGSFVAAQGAQKLAEQGKDVAALFLVAPPVHHYDFAALTTLGAGPVLVVQGDSDEVVPPGAVFSWATTSPLAPQVETVAGCGHFFHGCLAALKSAADRQVSAALQLS